MIAQITNDPVINLALDTIKLKKQAIVFANSKRSAEKTAEDIAKQIKNICLTELSEQIENALTSPTKQCKRLGRIVKKGVAFHHAGLTSKQREIIEDNFRIGKIKIICSTPTLAAGVDLPAYRTILKDLRRYTMHGLNWIPTLEYLQMAGRAGRPKYDKVGQAIAIATTDNMKEEIELRYIHGEPEDIYSKLAVEPVLRTYVLSLIATNFVKTKKQLIEFFLKTFWAHQYKDRFKLISIIEKMIKLLKDFEFITSSKDTSDFKPAYELEEDENYQATLIGKRVAQLYIDPVTAFHLIKGIKSAEKKQVDVFSWIQLCCHTLEMRPLLKVKVREWDKIQEEYLKVQEFILDEEPDMYDMEYDNYMASVKTALVLYDFVNETSEEILLEKYQIRPGELNVKLNNADWLLYACEELTRILKQQKMLKEISKARFRVKYGVKEELLALLKLKNVGRVRARKMFNNGFKDMRALKKADTSILAHLIGNKIALSIKEQLGIDVSKIKIKPKKKKGQISLLDY